MAGVVYLKTNRFEVKLEGITFKRKNFEALCKIDFLFPDDKSWDHPPIVGLDVMCHPRDPSVILLLLTFGVGCVILRFGAGEALPAPIHRFLADKRIRFVGFGIPEKMDLFPFQELGLSKTNMDIGYIAAKVYQDTKYKHYDLGQLARKVIGIKNMIGLTEESSFERHAQIKCAICQLFITNLVAMGLYAVNDKKKSNDNNTKKTSGSSFLKNLNSLQLLAEGWFKLPKCRKKHDSDDGRIQARLQDLLHTEPLLVDGDMYADDDTPSRHSSDSSPMFKFDGASSDDSGKGSSPPSSPPAIKPIKGILKCPSTTLNRCRSLSSPSPSSPSPLSRSPSMYHLSQCQSQSPSPSPSPSSPNYLKRANSKGCNVRFNFH